MKSDAAYRIAQAYNALAETETVESEPVCPFCGGDGWYVGHEDECYDTGDCNCSGVQVECECRGRVTLGLSGGGEMHVSGNPDERTLDALRAVGEAAVKEITTEEARERFPGYGEDVA